MVPKMDRKIYILCCCDTHAIDFALRHLNAQSSENVRRIKSAIDLWGLRGVDVHKLPCWLASPTMEAFVESLVRDNTINVIEHDS